MQCIGNAYVGLSNVTVSSNLFVAVCWAYAEPLRDL